MWRRTWRIAVPALLALHLGTAGAAAQELWGEIELPGGTGAARRLFGLGNDTRTDSHFLRDFARRHNGGPTEPDLLRHFDRYIAHLRQLDGALRAWPAGLQLPAGALPRAERDRWRDLCDLIGLRLREAGGQTTIELSRDSNAKLRTSWAQAIGIDPNLVAADLNARRQVRLSVPTTVLPLPLPAVWPEILGASSPPIARMAGSRLAMLLYAGLTALDPETLPFFGARPDFVKRLSEADAAVLAAFGRSLRIRNAVVATPGPAAAIPSWEFLVDAAPDDSERFVRNWLRRGDGRVAYFYDAVARLAPRQQAWLLYETAEPRRRERGIRAVYDHFAAVEPSWRVTVRPFQRPVEDPALALATLIAEAGVAPPAWPRVLERIVGGPDWPMEPLRRIDDLMADPQWLLRWLHERPEDVRRRLRLLQFAQRRFAGEGRDATGNLEVSLRGFYRMPALMLSLERMGVRTPRVLAGVAERARALTVAVSPDAAQPDLARFQSAIALIEQVRRHRAIPPDTIETLLEQLVAGLDTRGSTPGGAVAAWLCESMLPVLASIDLGSDPSEASVIAALLPSAAGPDDTLDWEGLRYQLDRWAPAVRDALAVRRFAGAGTLAEIAALHGIRRALDQPSPTPERIAEIADRIRAVQPALAELKDERQRVVPEVRQLERALRTLDRVKTAAEASRASRQLPAILAALDLVTARALPSLAYALAVAPTPQPQLYASMSARHAFWVKDAGVAWSDAAWRPSELEPAPEGGLRLRGSMLALDVTLAESQTRLIASREAADEPSFNMADYRSFIARLVLRSEHERADAAADAVVRELRAARARLRGPAGETGGRADWLRPILDRMAISQSRANFIEWSWRRGAGPAALERVSAGELLSLGADEDLAYALAVPAMPFDGCLCLRVAERRPVEDFANWPASGLLVVMLVDLQVALLEALGEIGLPAKLMEPLLPYAVTDVTSTVSQFYADDWEAIRGATVLTRERVEEYLLQLVAEGVLAPPATP